MQYQTNYPYATTSQQYGAISHLREEQRRRQQEYSQALAQQVAQREQQKRREREVDQQYGRRYGNFHNPPQQQQGFGPARNDNFEPAERGMLDGLGRNNHQSSRTSFARGQPQLHHRLPGGPELQGYPPQARASYGSQANFHHPNQPTVWNQSVPSNFGLPGNPHQPSQQDHRHQQPPQADIAPGGEGMPGFLPGAHVQTGWPEQNPQLNAMAQARSSQLWANQGLAEPIPAPPANGGYASPQRALQQSFQQEYPHAEQQANVQTHNGGRRQRTDIHDGSRGDSEEAERLRRKMLQQQEMQLALERQIEEKRQQKLEAKRRQDEEDRREMERFEEDRRRQRAEQERLQEEKRRKAELEQEKAAQAAAAVVAANHQAKLQQQQKLHTQAKQAQPEYQHPQHAQSSHRQQFHPQPSQQQREHFLNAPLPGRLKNPFTNSRAHLFEDPPPPPSSVPNHGYSNLNASPVQGEHQGFNHIYPQGNNPASRSMDPLELRRQYDDVREELRRQKQLVDQLRQAQEQLQQQQLSPVRTENGNRLTLMDLEKLRNELRGELEYREQLHRQELASLKREQQQERGSEHSPRHYPVVRNSIQTVHDKSQQLQSQPEANDLHALSTGATSAHFRRRQHQQLRNSGVQSIPRQSEHPIGESLISLRGESEFVYFDGRVAEAGKAAQHAVISRKGAFKDQSDSDSLDQQSESIKVEAPQALEVVRSSLTPRKRSVKRWVATGESSTSTQITNPTVEDPDSENDAQGFVIQASRNLNLSQQLTPSPTSHARRTAASSHRYSQLPPALTSSSPIKESRKWRLESTGTNEASDSDDDLDASLDGEQLEALFQRNVRRHEILLGFQTRVQAQTQESNQHENDRLPQAKSAWTELHQQLESNRRTSISAQRQQFSRANSSKDSTDNQKVDADNEAALVASSQWMPSSLFLPTEQATQSTGTLARNK